MDTEKITQTELISQPEPVEEPVPEAPANVPEAASAAPEEPSCPAAEEVISEVPAEAMEQPSADSCEEAPSECTEATRKRIRRKRIFRGALRFYSLLFGLILCVLILLCCLMTPLKTLLSQYETAQPQHTANEIYQMLFADPDWALLYDMAGIQKTQFEGRNEYVAYMESKVAGRELDCVEVAADLAGQRRYSIRLEDEEVATFTMIPMDDGVSTFGRWTIGEVEVYFTRSESVTVNIMPGYTVYINGIPLDGSYTTMTVKTVAEDILPENLHGYRYEQQHISGLLVPPEVIVLDEYNNPVSLTQDPNTGIYTVPIANTVPMTWGESDLILSTIQAEALFRIRAISASELRQHFTPGSQAYKDISGAKALAETYKSYAFDEDATVIRDFYRYSDDLFSARVETKLDVTNKKGKVKSYRICSTYFFTQNSVGNFTATERLDTDLQQLITHVRLTYAYDEAILLEELTETSATILVPPAITDDNGNAPLYWGALNEDGIFIRVLQLQPDGTYAPITGEPLDIMTLYPEFEEAKE